MFNKLNTSDKMDILSDGGENNMIAKKYQKINTVYKRDIYGKITDEMVDNAKKFGNLIYGGTEKIDGTNIRVEYIKDGSITSTKFGGRTNKAQIPKKLLEHLQETFTFERLQSAFGTDNIHVILYGEGYGAGIQKGGGLYRKDNAFILFDVDVRMDDGNFIALLQDNVEDIANTMFIPFAPEVFKGTILEAIKFVKDGQSSVVSQEYKVAEGLVLKQEDGLMSRTGKRLMFKVKIRDFK